MIARIKIPDMGYVFLAALIQLVNALDFMIIMPLGPDLSINLNISPTYIGYLGGGYTVSGALSSLVFAKFIDRFDRKQVALWALLGLSLSTLGCTFTYNMKTLFFARLLCGVFAGPATSIALAIVVDAVPVKKRGQAIAVVMGAFSIAAIAGVPLGLELSILRGWSAPFYMVSFLGVITFLVIYCFLPKMVSHLQEAEQTHPRFSFSKLLQRPIVLNSFWAIGIAIFSTFLIVPNIATYFQFNLNIPREDMSF